MSVFTTTLGHRSLRPGDCGGFSAGRSDDASVQPPERAGSGGDHRVRECAGCHPPLHGKWRPQNLHAEPPGGEGPNLLVLLHPCFQVSSFKPNSFT